MFKMSEQELRAWQFWSNRFFYDPRAKQAEIVTFKSLRGDWSVNHLLLKHGFTLLIHGWTVDVLFPESTDDVNRIPLTQLAHLLTTKPNLGKDQDHGPYHWVDKDRKPIPEWAHDYAYVPNGIPTPASSR
jgi:hypothetical protein